MQTRGDQHFTTLRRITPANTTKPSINTELVTGSGTGVIDTLSIYWVKRSGLAQ